MPEEKKRGGGPKTLEGKARSSQNRTTHGMRAKHLFVLADETPEQYQQLCDGWLAQFEPQSFVEEQLLEQLILNSWLMKRANRRYLEAEGAVAGGEKTWHPADWNAAQEHKLELMQRYKTTAERAFYRSFEAVQRLRKNNLNYEFVIAKIVREKSKLEEQLAESRKKEAPQQPQACVRESAKGHAKKKSEKLNVLEQWVEVSTAATGETVTKLYPSNEKLQKIVAKRERIPDLVYRRLFFVGAVPPEYGWTTSDARTANAGGLGVQRMVWERWLEQIAKESVSAGGHLQPCGGNLPRPKERGGCECAVCTQNEWMLKAAGLR
jgi:hypothetical protein